MGAKSIVRRYFSRAGGKARRLLPLAAALLLAALAAIPASNVALAQAPPGAELTLVNEGRAPSGRIRRRMKAVLGVEDFDELFELRHEDANA